MHYMFRQAHHLSLRLCNDQRLGLRVLGNELRLGLCDGRLIQALRDAVRLALHGRDGAGVLQLLQLQLGCVQLLVPATA